MNHSESISKLAAALCKAQGEVKTPRASGYNKFDKYAYPLLGDILEVAKTALHANGLSVLQIGSEVIAQCQRPTSKGGTEYHCTLRQTFIVMHESGEWQEFALIAEGQDRADKTAYKAATGGRKYAEMILLNMTSEEDPERDETVGTAPPVGNAPRRETPKPNGNPKAGDVVAEQIKGAIEAWCPHDPEDYGAIRDRIKAAYGLKGSKLADLQGLLAWIEDKIENHVSYADATKESK